MKRALYYFMLVALSAGILKIIALFVPELADPHYYVQYPIGVFVGMAIVWADVAEFKPLPLPRFVKGNSHTCA